MTFTNLGVAADPRTDVEKAQDIQHQEITGGSSPIAWPAKDSSAWKKYSLRDQDGSSSCVAQAIAKFLEIYTGIVQSAHPIYAPRVNAPGEGMFLANAAALTNSPGTTTEALDPSQHMNEVQMDSPVKVATSSNNFIPVNVNPKDIDAIAYAIQNYNHCILIVYGSISEWKDKPVYIPGATLDLGHAVCGVDFFLQNGEKCILIEDSWGKVTTIGNGGQRIITESYLKARFTAGMYFIPLQKPKHTFTVNLSYNMMGNPDVMALQDILKYEAFFPKEITSTGNFLTITAKAVQAWQVAHKIYDYAKETDLRNIRVGPKTIAALNTLYA